LVLFDLDGTIIDTMGKYAEIAAELISKYTTIPKEEARRRYLQLSGRPFRDQLKLMGIDERILEEIAREFERKKIDILAHSSPQPIVYDRINRLKRAGLKTALSTNNECHLVKLVKWMNKVFDFVLCHDPRLGLRKGLPHLERLESMGFRRCEIIFVGDSDYDLEVYKPYNIRAVRTKGLWKDNDRTVDLILEMLGENNE
jgi:phosphoglycolate phosphatase-like HAD superfamily hydrolase